MKQPLNNPGGSDTFRQMETKTKSVFYDVCLQSRECGFSFESSRAFPKLLLHKEEGDGQKERWRIGGKLSVEGGGDGNGGRSREPQVRGRQPHSSELITPSISLSDPERKEGGRMGKEGSRREQLALRWPRGEESWLLDSGSDFWGRKLDVGFFFLRLCGNVCLWTFMRTGGGIWVCVCVFVSVCRVHTWETAPV